MKKVLFLLILGLVAALPSLAMADSSWTGAISTDIQNPANWSAGVPHNEYYTEIGIVNFTLSDTPTVMPVIDSSVDVTWDCMQNESANMVQTGGSVHLLNYTSHLGLGLKGIDWTTVNYENFPGLDEATYNLYQGYGNRPGIFNMTGGTFTVDRVGLGYGVWDTERAPGDPVSYEQNAQGNPVGAGTGQLTIAGDAVFTVEKNTYIEETYCLWIHDQSYIDIRQDGELHVPVELTADVDAYIAAGKIINSAGAALVTETIGGEYVVTCVPEPGTLLLLCLGLGSLALIRRK